MAVQAYVLACDYVVMFCNAAADLEYLPML